MRKFSQAIPALHEAEGAVKSELQKSYAEYFKAKLTKFGVGSPAELTPDKKSEFFNEITKDWTRGEGATKAGQADVDEHGVKESLGINESAMGDVHIMAQEAKNFADFKKQFVKEFKVEGKDNNKELDSWLKQVHDSAMEEMKESTVNELEDVNAKTKVRANAIDRLSQFFRVSPYQLVKFNFDGNDNIKELTKALNSTSDEGTKLYYDTCIKLAKKDLGIHESEEVNEGKEIKSESEFKEYAMGLLKKAHPDDFDEEKANATVDGILKKCEGDFGAAVGMITSSLGESEVNEEKCPMCDASPCTCNANEGNAFGDAVKKAKDAGEKEFEFQGKTYKVEESEAPAVNDLNEGDLFLPHKTMPTITEEQLKKDIMQNIAYAFNKLLKEAGLSYNKVTAVESGGRIRFDSKPLTGNDLGIMKYGFKEVYINTFSGGSMPKFQKGTDEKAILFTPYIWFTINYSYKHGSESTSSTGSNGCSLYLPGETSDSIYYDIVNYKFLTASVAAKKTEWK